MMVDEGEWPVVVGAAIEGLEGKTRDRVLVNDRLSNGVCRLRIGRFGEPVDFEFYRELIGRPVVIEHGWHDGEVWPFEQEEPPEAEAEGLMYYAYLLWISPPRDPPNTLRHPSTGSGCAQDA